MRSIIFVKLRETKKFLIISLVLAYCLAYPVYSAGNIFADLFKQKESAAANKAGTNSNKADQTESATNQTAQQTIPLEQAFQDDTYENFASQEKNERKIFDDSLLGPQS